MAEEQTPTYFTMIRDLPRGERPRERLRDLGPGSLSNAELIAILLRTRFWRRERPESVDQAAGEP